MAKIRINQIKDGADSKETPIDADSLPIVDSTDTSALKKLTWANLKATLKSYFDTLYNYFSGSWNDLTDKPSTFPPSNHNHDDRYYTETEVNSFLDGKKDDFIENTAFNKDFGTTSGTVTEGNDSRLSDDRAPSDNSVTYAKIADDLKSSSAISVSSIDWSASGVFTKTLTANTTFTFSNVQLNKVITLILSGNFTVTLPASVKVISGEYDGSTTNYIQLHCTSISPQTVWCVISQEA